MFHIHIHFTSNFQPNSNQSKEPSGSHALHSSGNAYKAFIHLINSVLIYVHQLKATLWGPPLHFIIQWEEKSIECMKMTNVDYLIWYLIYFFIIQGSLKLDCFCFELFFFYKKPIPEY